MASVLEELFVASMGCYVKLCHAASHMESYVAHSCLGQWRRRLIVGCREQRRCGPVLPFASRRRYMAGLGDSPTTGFPWYETPDKMPDLSGHHSIMADVLKKNPKVRGAACRGVTLGPNYLEVELYVK